jgi:hypothetical protein
MNLPKPLRSVDAFWNASRALGPSNADQNDGAPSFFVVDGRVDRLRLVAGDYLHTAATGKPGAPELLEVRAPYWHYTRHYDRLHRTDARCSAGPLARFRDRREPCAGCDLYWSTLERSAPGRRSSSRMTRTAQYVFTAVDQGAYHPRRGRPRADGSGVKCLGAACRACAAGAPSRPGHAVTWDVGWKDLQVLRAAERAIGRACAGCGAARLASLAWVCAACGEAAVDLRAANKTEEELALLEEKNHRCRACGHAARLSEIIGCDACTPSGRAPRRATLFDVDIEVTRAVAEDGAPRLAVLGWSAPGPLDAAFAAHARPLDLPALFAPTPYAVQCTRFRVQTPPA